jgi:ketosteroid isomerase-like protein
MDGVTRTLNNFIQAFSNLNLDEIMQLFSSDSTGFFPIEHYKERLENKNQIRLAFKNVIDKIKGISLDEIKLPVEDLRIQNYGDFALATFHIRDSDFSRRTLVLKKDSENWFIQHIHASNAPLET